MQESARSSQGLSFGDAAGKDARDWLGLKMVFHDACQVAGGENDLGDALSGQVPYDPFEKRPARHRHHRFGHAGQQMRDAGPEAARQHHRLDLAQRQTHAAAQTLE